MQVEEFITHPLIKKNTVLRRAYQENIFINCLNHNSLVVIPTGLGKTIIALMLAVYKLTQYPDSKILFLAPTKPLVNQHYQSFSDLSLIEPEGLISITGSIAPEKRKELWKGLKVGFMTPQVLQNDIITGNGTIDDVSLIIFDECHRAVGDYSYCFIAKKYIQTAKHPHVLGLTASPGSTEDKINEIKENLFIEHVEIRTEKDADVIPYIQHVDNIWIKIKLPKEFLELSKVLEEKLKEMYKWLKEAELLDSVDLNKVSRKDLLNLNKIINRRISMSRDDSNRFQMFYAKKLQANTIRISHLLELIETQGISAAKDYVDKNVESIKKNTANKSLRELFLDKDVKRAIDLLDKIQEQGIIHPKIEKLRELLYDQILNNNESRILVFCHFRDSVNNLVKFFDDDDIVRAHKFVGQAKKGSDKGLSQKEQIELLKEFREGYYNVLVGTSVAEEGLDIEECDLVVFYDVVPSAIRSIQRRGRTGRKKEGKVCVLMAEGTRDEGYYWAERAKERKMKESLNKIQSKEGNTKSGQASLMAFVDNNEEEQDLEEEIIKEESANFEFDTSGENIHVICDNRETAGAVVRTLSLMEVDVRLEQLEVADYVVSNRTGIERKSAQDFTDSIKDGRLFKELLDLKNAFERPILILEQDPFLGSTLNENALYGAISSIILNLGITIYKTRDVEETAKFIYHLAKKEQVDSTGTIKLRFEKKPLDTSQILEYIIAGIPGINSMRAKSLLNEMKTLQTIFNSDIPDLLKIDGIGKKIAQEIYKLGRFKYQNEL